MKSVIIPALISTAIMGTLLAALSLGTASANPDRDNGQQAPPCHGANNNECRKDPQSDKGKDCIHSDDHVCQPTNTPQPTATSTPPTRLVSTPTPTSSPVPTSTAQPSATPTTRLVPTNEPRTVVTPVATIVPLTPLAQPPVQQSSSTRQVLPPVVLPRSGDGGCLDGVVCE